MLRWHICLLILLSLQASASTQTRSLWSFGFDLSVGANGDHIREYDTYDIATLGSGFYEQRNFWSPAVGGGFWVQRELGRYFGVQLGLQYQRIEYNLREQYADHLPNGNLRYAHTFYRQVLQHGLFIPLEFRYYLRRAGLRIRPFIGAHLSLGYFVAGSYLLDQDFVNPGVHTSRVAYRLALNHDEFYLKSSPWQGLYGGQVGIEIAPFIISVWHNSNMRRLHETVYYPCEFGNCINAELHPNFYRLLQHTQLRIAYEW